MSKSLLAPTHEMVSRWYDMLALSTPSRFPTSGVVKVFGRLHDDPIHTRRRQAFEKRQWTKSREVGDYGAAGSTRV